VHMHILVERMSKLYDIVSNKFVGSNMSLKNPRDGPWITKSLLLPCYLLCLFSVREPSSASTTIRPRWYGRGDEVSHAVVKYSPSCVWAVTVGPTCSHSCAVVSAGPTDANESGIRELENCVAGENWTQDLGSDTMLDDSSLSVQP
jgi:hypothetical protein